MTHQNKQKTLPKNVWMTRMIAAMSQKPGNQHLVVMPAARWVLSTFSGSVGGGMDDADAHLIANSWMIHADGPGLMDLAQSLA